MPIAPTYRLIYASHIAPVCLDDLKSALVSIVSRSIPANRKARITGLLIAHKGWFVQALEGPRAAVEALFETIAADLPEKAKTLLTILHRNGAGS